MELIRTFYSVYRDGRLVKRGIGRDELIAGLYKAWFNDEINVHPTRFVSMGSIRFDNIDVSRLVEAVNEEGIIKITQEDKKY